MKKVIATLCLVTKENRILLGMKKRGFGAGRWNGFGGKVASGEPIEIAARRELWEESGIEARDCVKRAELMFTFADKDWAMQVHVFQVIDFSGEPNESEEMLPRWFSLDDIPYEEMWPNDRYWLPRFLAGKNLSGNFHFDQNDQVATYSLEEIGEFEKNHYADN